MFDVSIYGHLTIDRIFSNFQKDHSIGSMGNVWRHLNRISPSLKINLEPTDIGEALIFVNKEKSERFSVANLNLKTRKPNIVASRWSHVLYLNELSDCSFLEDMENTIVSVDLCRGKIIEDLNVLRNVDFLFVSDEDIFMDPDDLCKFVKRGVIYHHPGGSKFYGKDGNQKSFNVRVIKNINVLGCGDMLVAGFIASSLEGNTVYDSIQKSHNMITNFLINKEK